MGDAYMIAQAGVVQRLPALYLPRRPAARIAIFPCLQSIALVARRHRNIALLVTLAASALPAALAIWASVEHQDVKLDTSSLVAVRNETVVYRQAPRPDPIVAPQTLEHPYSEQLEASDELDDDSHGPKYSRTVEVVRYVNPEGPTEIGNVTSPAGESIQKELVKVGGFVAFRPKEDEGNADEKESILPRQRGASIMDQVDDYLWEVYQRVPIKKDGTGDFTWKDPAAAKQMGLSLRDYVIGGMDPEFREQLYHAGHAMDAAGLQWSLLSAFRDDYRQSLASGYKASVSNSLHGGSRRTGGYGHGRAIDITGPEDKESDVWKWMDAHGAKYGLHRPLPKADPAHVQQLSDWQRIALALRESRIGPGTDHKKIAVALRKSRTRSATDHKAKVSARSAKAKARKTAVASAR
jgi:hypothetical protein